MNTVTISPSLTTLALGLGFVVLVAVGLVAYASVHRSLPKRDRRRALVLFSVVLPGITICVTAGALNLAGTIITSAIVAGLRGSSSLLEGPRGEPPP
jgi:hypothetical protein